MLRVYKKFDIDVPSGAKQIIQKLKDCGFKAYLIGGCVRDSILGRSIKDWDIVTDAPPGMIENIFDGYCKPIGRSFGVIQVEMYGEKYEVSTFRQEREYNDSRHPSVVHFVDNLKEDCIRRDFTINQLAYDITTKQVYDYFGGVKDLKRKVVRCVGNPQDRFNEDPLRMLRAIRFANKLGFSINKKALKVMFYKNVLLEEISKERIREEFVQILSHGQNIRTLYETQISKYIIPEFHYGTFFVILETVDIIENFLGKFGYVDISVLLAMFFYCIGYYKFERNMEVCYEKAEKTLKEDLKMPKSIIKSTLTILKHINFNVDFSPYSVKKLLNESGDNAYHILCIMESMTNYVLSQYAVKKEDTKYMFGVESDSKENIRKGFDNFYQIIRDDEPYLLSDLAINGDDLKFLEPKYIGEVLDICLEYVISDKSYNNRRDLLNTIVPNILYCKGLTKENKSNECC